MRPGYYLAKWQMRADTILRKAQDLQSDMITVLGVEHELTDWGDNVIDQATTLVNAIERHRHLANPIPCMTKE